MNEALAALERDLAAMYSPMERLEYDEGDTTCSAEHEGPHFRDRRAHDAAWRLWRQPAHQEAHLTFKGSADGEIAFGALKGLPRCPIWHSRWLSLRGILVGGA